MYGAIPTKLGAVRAGRAAQAGFRGDHDNHGAERPQHFLPRKGFYCEESFLFERVFSLTYNDVILSAW